jgi:hypothetical protein
MNRRQGDEGKEQKNNTQPTLALTPSFLGAAFFFVTPAGFTGLTAGSAAGALALGLVVRLMAGAVSTVWNTRGRALPVAERVPSRGILTEKCTRFEMNEAARAIRQVRIRCSSEDSMLWHVLRQAMQTRNRMRHEGRTATHNLQWGGKCNSWVPACGIESGAVFKFGDTLYTKKCDVLESSSPMVYPRKRRGFLVSVGEEKGRKENNGREGPEEGRGGGACVVCFRCARSLLLSDLARLARPPPT